jgi:hypothetical protein
MCHTEADGWILPALGNIGFFAFTSFGSLEDLPDRDWITQQPPAGPAAGVGWGMVRPSLDAMRMFERARLTSLIESMKRF